MPKSGTKVVNPVMAQFSLTAPSKALNPALSALFSSSAGPLKRPAKQSKAVPSSSRAPELLSDEEEEQDDEVLSEASEEFEDPEDDVATTHLSHEGQEQDDEALKGDNPQQKVPKRKRKRDEEDDLESRHLQKIAREEERDFQKLQAERAAKRARQVNAKAARGVKPVAGTLADEEDEEEKHQNSDENIADADEGSELGEDIDDPIEQPPMHETLELSKDEEELEKARRTVFLANVATSAITDKAAKKTLLAHLASFFPHLPADSGTHKVESIRFRSTAYSTHVPRKAAFARKEIMDETSKSTNAYAVYSTKVASREAAKRLNGTVVLGRHLRVDEVAHPMKQDHRRCVFVGNLGFVDDETRIRESEKAEGKNTRKPLVSDTEEGLWVQFSKAGKVESVRVVRDAKTRISKGIAYVQFADENAVEAALLFNEKKFPPLLPRRLRVTRAKKFTAKKEAAKNKPRIADQQPRRKGMEEARSLQGRVSKLLGKAGAASVRKTGALETTKTSTPGTGANASFAGGNASFKTPETIIFEGARATRTKKPGLKMGGSGKKRDGKRARKPTHGNARSQAWKKSGRPARN